MISGFEYLVLLGGLIVCAIWAVCAAAVQMFRKR